MPKRARPLFGCITSLKTLPTFEYRHLLVDLAKCSHVQDFGRFDGLVLHLSDENLGIARVIYYEKEARRCGLRLILIAPATVYPNLQTIPRFETFCKAAEHLREKVQKEPTSVAVLT